MALNAMATNNKVVFQFSVANLKTLYANNVDLRDLRKSSDISGTEFKVVKAKMLQTGMFIIHRESSEFGEGRGPKTKMAAVLEIMEPLVCEHILNEIGIDEAVEQVRAAIADFDKRAGVQTNKVTLPNETNTEVPLVPQMETLPIDQSNYSGQDIFFDIVGKNEGPYVGPEGEIALFYRLNEMEIYPDKRQALIILDAILVQNQFDYDEWMEELRSKVESEDFDLSQYEDNPGENPLSQIDEWTEKHPQIVDSFRKRFMKRWMEHDANKPKIFKLTPREKQKYEFTTVLNHLKKYEKDDEVKRALILYAGAGYLKSTDIAKIVTEVFPDKMEMALGVLSSLGHK